MAELKIKKKYITYTAVLVLLIVGVTYMMNQQNANPQVTIQTSMGDVVVELYPNEAPITVENFLSYVDAGFYDGLVFHRVIDGFMIQGGGFEQSGNQKETNPSIKLESDNGLKNDKGTIAMARTGVPDSATSQFFINDANNDFLNKAPGNDGYAVFGKVVKGIEVVEAISAVQTTTKRGFPDWPAEEVIIQTIKRS